MFQNKIGRQWIFFPNSTSGSMFNSVQFSESSSCKNKKIDRCIGRINVLSYDQVRNTCITVGCLERVSLIFSWVHRRRREDEKT